MKNENFDVTKNYYDALHELDKAELINIPGIDVKLIRECRKEMIKDILENGSESNKKDLGRYLIDVNKSFIIEGNSVSVLLERGIPFDPNLYLTSKQQYSLGCYDDPGQRYGLYTAYFKVFNDRDVSRSTKCARITFLDPSYIHHKDPYGKEDWELDQGERKDLDQILHKVVYGETIWFWLTYEFFVLTGLDFDFGNVVPSYRNISENVKKENRKNDSSIIKSTERNRRRK